MKLLLMMYITIFLLSGITFFAITGDILLLYLPGVVNFIGLGIVGMAYKLLIKENHDEEYNSYRGAHSL